MFQYWAIVILMGWNAQGHIITALFNRLNIYLLIKAAWYRAAGGSFCSCHLHDPLLLYTNNVSCCALIEMDLTRQNTLRVSVWQPHDTNTHCSLSIHLHLVVWHHSFIIVLFQTSVVSPICCASDVWQLNTVLIYNITLFCMEKAFELQRSGYCSAFCLSVVLSWWALLWKNINV